MPRNQCEREEPASEAAHILKPGLGPRQAVEIGQERLAGRQADWHTPVVIPALVASVLAALGGLHVYWACGGSWGRRVAVPEVSGRPAFATWDTRLFSPICAALAAGFFWIAAS